MLLTCTDCGADFKETDVQKKDRSEFIREYVLARAGAVTNSGTIVGLDAITAAETAAQVYDRFIK